MDTNIIYDEKNDYLYILLYKLGSGSYATVWFSIEIKSFYKNLRTNNTNKDILCYKALKIHNEEDYDEGIMETTIKNKLTINNKKCDYINYPTSHFIHDESIVIVVYNVAIGSLYDIMKKYNYKYSKDVIDKIMPQLTESIKFVHECGYIHTDIKPENFLIAGTNKLQNELQEYVKNYNLIKKIYNVFKKSMKIGDVLETIEPVIYKFIKDIGAKYDMIEHILPNDGSNESSEGEGGGDSRGCGGGGGDSRGGADGCGGEGEESDSDSSIDTNCSSYNSVSDMYEHYYDKFHIDEILQKLDATKVTDEKDCTGDGGGGGDGKENIDIKNMHILLTDFGLMMHKNTKNKTVSSRYYRAPEVVLGLPYDQTIDMFALGCTVYELITSEILLDIEGSSSRRVHDKDAIHITNFLMLYEPYPEMHTYLMDLIEKSPRRDYVLSLPSLPYLQNYIYARDNWGAEVYINLLHPNCSKRTTMPLDHIR